jgi:serine/threonine protein kinase
MSAKPLDEEVLFHAARRIADPEARAQFINQACGDNAGLAERVRALVEMHEQEDDSADRPSAQTRDYEPVVERPGARVGPYRLMEQIGEGGFGLVFVAEQQEPVKRKVALKIIKPGMDSAQVIARFEAERQALALMDHPNIARVLDAGATDSGRPYFVMELVRGIPITEYCDKHQLSPHERLELFITVCQAIQHAHQKGIIHRDVKPSNVLVTSHDGKPAAKVIDFGVAKAIHQHLTERTIYTHFAQMIGTPLYMSPEQAEMSGLDIDTRSDIYSLGVLLYELLTGTTPLEKHRLRQAAYDEIRRLIREEEPPKPSTRLSTSESIAAVAAQRKMEPAKLSKLVRGDLDWITMKALDKDRTRRYETANGLARDIQRYLSDEPVEASPPSTVYRLRKLARKHRTVLTTAAAFVVLLTAGAGIATWQAVRATQAETLAVGANTHLDAANTELKRSNQSLDAANQNLTATNHQLELARQAADRAAAAEKTAADKERAARMEEERQRKFAEAIRQFVQDDFLALTSVEGQERFGGAGHEALSKDTTLGQLLDRAAEKLRSRQDLDPRIEAELCWIVGVNYRCAGEAAKGVPFLERAVALRKQVLGRDHEQTLDALNSLAVCYGAAGKMDLAQTLLEETLKLQKAKLGPDHPGTLASMNNLASEYSAAGKLDLALPLLEELLQLIKAKLGPDHRHTLTSMNSLATAYQDAGKLHLAVPLYEETLKVRRAKFGPDHPDTLNSMNNLAYVYQRAGKLDVALLLFQETLKLHKAKLGPDHPNTLIIMNNLAEGYRVAGELDLALPLYEETLKVRKAKLGPDHPDTLTSMNNLALGYLAIRKLDLALALYEETLKLRKAKLGLDHPDTLTSMGGLAGFYWSIRRLDQSISLYEETLKLREKKIGRSHPATQLTVANLGVNYRDAGRLTEALPLLEEAYRASRTIPTLRWVGAELLDGYSRAGKAEAATTLARDLVAGARQSLPRESPQLAGVLAQYGVTLLQLKAFTDAEPLLRETLAIREKHQAELWSTYNTQSMLGGALLGQKKNGDAEPLLLKGYEGMKTREKTIPPQGKVRLTEAAERLVQLYETTGNAAEAERWRKELAELKAGNAGKK